MLTNTRISAYDKHGKVWRISCQAEYRGFQVFMMPTQIDQGDEFGRMFTNIFCSSRLTVVHHLREEEKFFFKQTVENTPTITPPKKKKKNSKGSSTKKKQTNLSFAVEAQYFMTDGRSAA